MQFSAKVQYSFIDLFLRPLYSNIVLSCFGHPVSPMVCSYIHDV